MPSTVLAVEDSVTMRRVLEITFAGGDFTIVTADSADAALQKLKTLRPDVVIADLTLDPKSGYDVCKAVKQAVPGVPVLLLSSKQNPFDAAKGSASQADDHIDKPFDTQQMIDKVKKLLGGGKAEVAAAAPAAAPVQRPAQSPLASTIIGTAAPSPNRTMPSAGQMAAQALASGGATPGAPAQRAKTLVYNPGVAMPPLASTPTPAASTPATSGARPAAPAMSAPATAPARAPAATPLTGVPAVQRSAPVAAAAEAQINGQMAAKLEELGLTPAQVEAVTALSRDVVERVVWEVVPVLAETLIREEIARLVK